VQRKTSWGVFSGFVPDPGRRPTVHPAQGTALGRGAGEGWSLRPNGPTVLAMNRWAVGPSMYWNCTDTQGVALGWVK
jgi:hypothetical protein